MRMNQCLEFVLQTFNRNPSHIYIYIYITCCVCFSRFYFLKLVTLLHFIPAIAPNGIHSSFTSHSHTLTNSSFVPSPFFLYSYSTLAARLIPRQSSFPSTFPTLGQTYISTPSFTHFPILSSPGIYAEQLFFISIQALITFRLRQYGPNREHNFRSWLWSLWVILPSSRERGNCSCDGRNEYKFSEV
jgi:hypothetical protein